MVASTCRVETLTEHEPAGLAESYLLRLQTHRQILYQGSALVIYYAPNSWNFTRLGKIDDVTAEELRESLGDSNVTVTLSLPQE